MSLLNDALTRGPRKRVINNFKEGNEGTQTGAATCPEFACPLADVCAKINYLNKIY